MTEEQRKEIEELITKNPDIFTPRMVWDIFWCAKHEEEIRKMMGMLPCDSEERYRILDLFLMEGQTGLYFAMRYSSIYGKTEEEIAEEEKRITCYNKKMRKNQPKPKKRYPYDYDLEFKYQEDSFLDWCDDYDCAALVRKNKDDDLLRLSYVAMAIGYMELGSYIASQIHSELLSPESEQDKAELKSLEEKWIREFIDKQPEGERKEELKQNIATNWPRLKAAKPDCSE